MQRRVAFCVKYSHYYVTSMVFALVGAGGVVVLAFDLMVNQLQRLSFLIVCFCVLIQIYRDLSDCLSISCPYIIEISDGDISIMRSSAQNQCVKFEVVENLSPVVLWPFLIALKVRFDNGTVFNIVLFRDALSCNDFRRLSAILRSMFDIGSPKRRIDKKLSDGNF
ncbi:protein YgfX [Undibacterium fentianense]|uniref:Uncharacterized protein n=1 Tax=Undibacterium fentianense TaxID=2828728 RepID=A0A941IEW9_9BURK|nr:protein YgfX [Undibacterium fentianense]MBR7798465.1 hypothetical protein [Undibacterium fentianense]